MREKPKQFSPEYASIFQDAGVVAAYRHRPPYPEETFTVLLRLIPPGTASRVLDAGCGTGFIARPLAAYVDLVDAVDIAPRMIAEARTLPGGGRPNLTWIAGPVETAPLSGLYALIVAAASLHWMDWEHALPRFADLLVPGGLLALVEEVHAPHPWDRATGPILTRYSLNKDFAPYTMAAVAAELAQRGLFRPVGRHQTAFVPFQQPIEDYIESFHARNGLSRERMGPEAAGQFDAALRAVVEPHCPRGLVEQQIAARILWGNPLHGGQTL